MNTITMITVSYKNETPLRLPTENNSLRLDCLKEYYPSANGLIYLDENGLANGLQVKEGQIILNPSISHYQVHLAEAATNVNSADDAKIARIRMFRDQLEGQKVGAASPILSVPPPSSRIRKSKVADLRKAMLTQSNTPKFKSVNIGWKHRVSPDKKKFIHKKSLSGGSSRELELDMAAKFSVQDIIDLSIKEFENDKEAAFTLANSTVCLGLFSGELFDKFVLPNGEEVGLWNYLTEKQLISGRINLYLHSTANADFKEKYHTALADGMFEEFNDTETENSVDSIDNSQLLPKPLPLADLTNQIKADVSVAKDGKDDVIVQESNKTVVLKDQIQDIKPGPVSQEKKEQIPSSTLAASPTPLNTLQNSSCPIIEFVRNYSKINLTYSIVKVSEYTNETMCFEQSADDIYYNLMGVDNHLPDKLVFEPLEYGYTISSITMNNNRLFNAYKYVGEDRKLIEDVTFGDLLTIEPHSIAYDTNTIFGFGDDNHLRIGFIPTCVYQCASEYTWYRNGAPYKKSRTGFCIRLPIESETVTWHCTFNCSQKGIMQSKLIKVDKNIFENSSTVQEVNKHQFQISKNCIGAGSSSKVYEGSFSGVKVAIKSINIYSRYTKLVQREIAVLKQLNHECFIRLFAYCKEEKKVHLITEYFESHTLQDVINNEELQQECKFDIDVQDSICLQLCRAISFLHNRSNPIIHKDIKTQNILLNKYGIVKLCDFGLSKFSIMATALQTTTHSKVVGTKLYMAPEILLNKRDATTASDIWSFACSIVEIYKKEVVWDVESEEELINKLSDGQLPITDAVPARFRDTLHRCFSYEPTDRPAIQELWSIWNSAYLDTIREFQK